MERKARLTIRLIPGRHYEAIASFYLDGEPWATPLGFRLVDSDSILVNVYSGTRTFTAITSGVDVVLNIVRDPAVYLYTTFKNFYKNWRNLIKFDKGVKVKAPRILNAEAYIELKPLYIQYNFNTARAIYRIVDIYPGAPILEPHSRCISHIIDAIIYLTKLRDIKDKKLREKYRLSLAVSIEIIRKTCDVNLFTIISEIENIYRKLIGITEHSGPR